MEKKIKRITVTTDKDCEGNPRQIIHQPCINEWQRLAPIQFSNYLVIQEILDRLSKNTEKKI